ncbi:hypothetical protein L861_02355 [Litchfieldella anticariensis FP35 = DSM 16096]|uniref:Tyrosine protein kinase n=2 Tax=Litchfieldella anticariensis TaxID=258591 RepID=S2L8K1_LITA3|nr:hypothetical protein L861_02355 [Halomonas anticariensis FP35 = DSM 16096]
MPPKPGIPALIYNPVIPNDSIDVVRLLGMLLDYKWLIACIVLVFTLTGIVYASLQTPIYRSDALVQVEGRRTVSPIGGPENNGDETIQGASIAAEVEILRSRMVLGKVVDRLGLDTIFSPQKLPVIGDYVLRNNIVRPDVSGLPLVGGWLNKANHPALWAGENIEITHFDVVDGLRGQPLILKVMEEEKYHLYMNEEFLGEGDLGTEAYFIDGAVQVRVKTLNAHAGAEFTLIKLSQLDAINALASRLSISEVGGGNRGPSTGMLRVTLTGADRNEIRQTLDTILDTFLIQNVERKAEATQRSLAFLEQQAPELRSKLSNAEDRLSEYRASVDSIDVDAEGQSIIQQFIDIERQVNEVSIQEADLAQRFTRNHPTYQSLARQKAYLISERDRLEQRVSTMPAAQQEVIRRTRDVEVTQAIYVNVLNKLQELELVQAGTVGTLRIIDTAAVGRVPIYPNKASMVGMSFILGLLVAIIVVVVRGLFNRGVESPEQLESLGLPVYATVPLSGDQAQLERVFQKRRRKAGNSGILANSHPADTAVEALRGLRTALHFAMLDASNNCLMICGPSPGIGKSFVALNLSAVCVQGGHRVLVIDADLRKGNLHRAFDHASEKGLSEVLSGRLELSSAIRSSGFDRFDYLSRGMAAPNPSELLMNVRFTELMDKVSKEYDLVILDTPPVLAVTDAAIIGKQAGTSLMVARFQMNPPKEIKLAINRLENSGVEVRGCIINGMQRKASAAYGYGYYQYSYTPDRHKKGLAEHV